MLGDVIKSGTAGPQPIATESPRRRALLRPSLLLLTLLCALGAGAMFPALAQGLGQSASAVGIPEASAPEAGRAASEPAGLGEPASTFGAKLRRALWIFFLLCAVALVLLVGTVFFVLWRAKQLVENAVKPNLPALERVVERLRAKHPDLSDRALAKKLIHRQANRAGLVGLVTGIGGLPTLPITIPIDIAATIKIQSNLVHLLRIVQAGREAENISDASLWLITTGGHELTAASSALIRELLVKTLSKSLLKFLPLVGGVVGYALNWISTQGLGRLSREWLKRRSAPAEAASVAGPPLAGSGSTGAKESDTARSADPPRRSPGLPTPPRR